MVYVKAAWGRTFKRGKVLLPHWILLALLGYWICYLVGGADARGYFLDSMLGDVSFLSVQPRMLVADRVNDGRGSVTLERLTQTVNKAGENFFGGLG